jgi:hypothetical protein
MRGVSGPLGAAPPRVEGSVRRTSSLDVTWPGGPTAPSRVVGRCRDLLTTADGVAVVAEDLLEVVLGPDRVILDIAAAPARPALSALVGARGGGRLRGRLLDAVPEERAAGTPLYLLLDDLAGASLVSGFAWTQWPERLPPAALQPARGAARRMEGICIGFRTGSSGLNVDGSPRFNHDLRVVGPLASPDDPLGWHELPTPASVAMRRVRRIDVTIDDVVHVDAMFQDSVTRPEGTRVAVHEYALSATASNDGVLLSVSADPRVLPYRECPLAADNVHTLVGTRLEDLREVVLDRLKGVAGCTHLNDALRALAEVPGLVVSR